MRLKTKAQLIRMERHTLNGKIGIYFMYEWSDELVYIGQSINLIRRIHEHPNKKFRYYKYIECEKSELNLLEKSYIKLHKPKFNIMHNNKEAVHVNIYKKTGFIDEYFERISGNEILILKEFDKFIFQIKFSHTIKGKTFSGFDKYCFNLSDLPKGETGLLENFGKSFFIRKNNKQLYVDEI